MPRHDVKYSNIRFIVGRVLLIGDRLEAEFSHYKPFFGALEFSKSLFGKKVSSP